MTPDASRHALHPALQPPSVLRMHPMQKVASAAFRTQASATAPYESRVLTTPHQQEACYTPCWWMKVPASSATSSIYQVEVAAASSEARCQMACASAVDNSDHVSTQLRSRPNSGGDDGSPLSHPPAEGASVLTDAAVHWPSTPRSRTSAT